MREEATFHVFEKDDSKLPTKGKVSSFNVEK